MKRLLLNSRGLNQKTGTLQILAALKEVGIEDLRNKTIFVVSLPDYCVDNIILENCIRELGMQKEHIIFSAQGIPEEEPDIVYVTEGNTFEVLQYMRDNGLDSYIREVMLREDSEVVYIGSSAGAMIAGIDILLAGDFDRNFVEMTDFTALGLFKGTIIPHYEPEELERYIANTEDMILNRYEKVYSVSNEKVLVLDCLCEEELS